MAREIVGSMSDWSGVLKDLFRQIDDGSLTLEQLKAVVEHQNPFIDLDSLLLDWRKFYEKYFKFELDFSKSQVPKQQIEFNRLIIVTQRLTLNQIYNVCAKRFPCWRYVGDLDKAVTKNDRIVDQGSYAVWFRDRREADEELKNLSANQLAQKKILGITLLERLLYELKYWDENSGHLDIANWTLCSGSRDVDGYVPNVIWDYGKLKVNWSDSNYCYDNLRARAAVPLNF